MLKVKNKERGVSVVLEMFDKLKNGYLGLFFLHLLPLLNPWLIVEMQPA